MVVPRCAVSAHVSAPPDPMRSATSAEAPLRKAAGDSNSCIFEAKSTSQSGRDNIHRMDWKPSRRMVRSAEPALHEYGVRWSVPSREAE